MKRVLIATGGTGGHIYPALSVANELKKKQVDVFFTGTKYRMEKDVVPENGFKFYGFSMKPIKSLKGIWWLLISTFQAIKVIKKENPDVVIGFGNYISVPSLLAGLILRKKIYLHEQNVDVGLANKLFYRFADKLFLSFEGTYNIIPRKYQHKISVAGNPLRNDFYIADRQREREKLKLGQTEKMLLIIGGSLGAKAINDKVLQNWEKFLNEKNLRVYWSTGKDKFDEINKEISRMKKDDVIRPYFENIPYLMSASDLILCRAGASTVSEIIETSKPSIFIPYKYVGQANNAKVLEQAGGSLIFEEENLDEAINEIFKLLHDDVKLYEMSRRLWRLKKGNAAKKIMEEIDIWRK